MIRDGFIRVAASTPEVKVADVEYNREQVCEQIEEGAQKGRFDYGISRAGADGIYVR